MMAEKMSRKKRNVVFAAVFLLVNVVAVFVIAVREQNYIEQALIEDASEAETKFEGIMDNYKQSFQIFVEMMAHEIEMNPEPDDIWDYLKSVDSRLLEIEGETFDGLYMYYKQRYLYSWNTPYTEYEGYVATERPWYQAAVAEAGEIVFTPPYKSYANPYILTTISQLQPDGETVFAYDIKMGDIQKLVEELTHYDRGQVMIYDGNGTVIGSTDESYLGGSFYGAAKDQEIFSRFKMSFEDGFKRIENNAGNTVSFHMDGDKYYGCVLQKEDFNFLILVPAWSVMKATVSIWLIPLLIVELLLIYILSRIGKRQKNRELERAYVELGQTQKRLELALSAAQKAAAIDDLTGMMNYKSFRREVVDLLDNLDEDESGILIMIDIDRFKSINDNYGHAIGDEVIKLTAQMIIGRIRTVDLASRLHGDEFAIFVANTSDYAVGGRIMGDINLSIRKEAERRKMPSITLSAGAVIARRGDTLTALSKAADTALYEAKKDRDHNGGFAY